MVGRDLAVDRTVIEIHSGLDSETVAVASAELFATVAEIVAVVDAAIDERVVDGKIDATADVVVDARCAAADGVIDAVVAGAEGAMSDEAFDEQDIQRGPVEPEVHNFHPVMSVVDHYLVDTSASRQTAYLSADCSGRKYYRR